MKQENTFGYFLMAITPVLVLFFACCGGIIFATTHSNDVKKTLNVADAYDDSGSVVVPNKNGVYYVYADPLIKSDTEKALKIWQEKVNIPFKFT